MEEQLKKYGKWNDVEMLDTSAINKIIQDKKWDEDTINKILNYVNYKESKQLYLSKLSNRD